MDDEFLKYYKVPPEALATVPYIPISPEERKRRVSELNQKVKENVLRLQNSATFREFLTAMSRFHRYSWNNQILIWIQKPNATRVAGYNTWRDLGRYVKAGEKGIAILAPLGPTALTIYRNPDGTVYFIKRSDKGWAIYDEDDNIVYDGFKSYAEAEKKLKAMGFTGEKQTVAVHNFKIVHVFDISQTDGKPLPEFVIPPLTNAPNPALFDELLRLVTEQGVTVTFESRPGERAKGEYTRNRIWIRPEETEAEQLRALLHEVAHHYTETVFSIPRRDAETIAECAAYIVGAHYGFDTGITSFPYVAIWARDQKTLAGNLDAIQRVAERIIDQLEARRARLLPMTR